MLGLEKVLDLQIHYNKLEKSKKELDELERNQELSKLERVYISDKKNLEKVLIVYKDNEKDIRNDNRELEDYQVKIKKTETTLYDGWITDLKQLEHLNKEKAYLEELVDTLENKILDTLEKNENLEKSIKDWQNEIINKEKMISDLEKQTKKSLTNIKKEIEMDKIYIEKCSEEIDPEVLEMFLSIKEKKNTGISTIIDGVCSECNIMIRPAQIDRIKLGKQIYTCESCGRLLLFVDTKEV
ncbi:MAG: C4-type zinc ribbon domain-containing protein [Gudongella sp.]|nr:C4-type zinc ribbon domain-containing protein [Gudongella sp.]